MQARFVELGDGTRVCERIDGDVALAPLDRKVARQVALRMALAANAGKGCLVGGLAVRAGTRACQGEVTSPRGAD